MDPRGDPDAAFEAVAAQAERADALAVGPGLGHDEPVAGLVRRLVREVDVPLVLDADGLNVFKDDGDALADHAAPLLACTPHARELARLVRLQRPRRLGAAGHAGPGAGGGVGGDARREGPRGRWSPPLTGACG